MAEEKLPVEEKNTTPAAGAGQSGKRKYTYIGKIFKNPKVFNRYGTMKIRPWEMTDDQIDKCIAVRPDLARLWKTN